MSRALLIDAAFVERPNRFVVRARLDSGRGVEAHLADPGRLVELLVPNAALRLRRARPGTSRRTRYGVVLVRSPTPPRVWVSLEAARANELAAELLSAGRVRGARGELQREVRHGSSRIDFRLRAADGRRTWVEVKSVTLAESGVGLFPDAPTERGVRHLRELIRLRAGDEAAMVLFVAQRGDVESIRPHRGIDPAFAAMLGEATRAGVMLRGARFRMDAAGGALHLGPVPVVCGRS